MTNTATAVPVDDVGDDLQGERDALLQALAGLAEERYRQRGL